MPSGSFLQQEVVCPFYQWDDGKRKIICEGMYDRCSLDLRWRHHVEQERYMKIFCCEHYKKCEIYRMIYQCKYAEEEG